MDTMLSLGDMLLIFILLFDNLAYACADFAVRNASQAYLLPGGGFVALIRTRFKAKDGPDPGD